MSSETIGFGVIAVGGIGSLHARNIANRVPGARLVAVTDTDPARAEGVAAEHSAVACASTAELLARSDIDAVVIASPSPFHAEATVAAVDAGKHVLCEKPMTCTAAEADQVVSAVATADVIVQVGFQRRHDPDWRCAAALLGNGRIGRPRLYLASYREREPLDGDHLRDLLIHGNIHDLDAARWLMGEIDEISVIGQSMTGAALADGAAVENLVTTLRFSSGALGVIDNGTNARFGFECKAEIVGSTATARIGNSQSPAVIELSDGGLTRPYPADSAQRFDRAYVHLIADFCATTRGGAPSGAAVSDGRAALVLALAAEASLLGGRPVRLRHRRGPTGIEYETADCSHAFIYSTTRFAPQRQHLGELMSAPLPFRRSVAAGDFVAVSGQVGAVDGTLVEGGVAAQTRQALANFVAILEQHGLTAAHVIKTNVFLLTMDDFAAMNSEYAQVFTEDHPARSAVAVHQLPFGAVVEIEGWAFRGK